MCQKSEQFRKGLAGDRSQNTSYALLHPGYEHILSVTQLTTMVLQILVLSMRLRHGYGELPLS